MCATVSRWSKRSVSNGQRGTVRGRKAGCHLAAVGFQTEKGEGEEDVRGLRLLRKKNERKGSSRGIRWAGPAVDRPRANVEGHICLRLGARRKRRPTKGPERRACEGEGWRGVAQRTGVVEGIRGMPGDWRRIEHVFRKLRLSKAQGSTI